ncbi:hypothetical protein PpBr36_04959, partial [Pyricularia pennisetigena]|uniref:hypothetical protein n=1 Tax=Pyricularia pennisetigena TaxID=1578925 RepID=UPI001151134E
CGPSTGFLLCGGSLGKCCVEAGVVLVHKINHARIRKKASSPNDHCYLAVSTTATVINTLSPYLPAVPRPVTLSTRPPVAIITAAELVCTDNLELHPKASEDPCGWVHWVREQRQQCNGDYAMFDSFQATQPSDTADLERFVCFAQFGGNVDKTTKRNQIILFGDGGRCPLVTNQFKTISNKLCSSCNNTLFWLKSKAFLLFMSCLETIVKSISNVCVTEQEEMQKPVPLTDYFSLISKGRGEGHLEDPCGGAETFGKAGTVLKALTSPVIKARQVEKYRNCI